MNLVGQANAKDQQQTNQFQEIKFKPCLEKNLGCFSKRFFIYTHKLIKQGILLEKKKEYLTAEDLHECKDQIHPRVQQKLIKEIMQKNSLEDYQNSKKSNQQQQLQSNKKGQENQSERKLFTQIMTKIINKQHYSAAVYMIIGQLLQFTGPIGMKLILEYLDDENPEYSYIGYIYASVIFVSFFMRAFIINNGMSIVQEYQMTSQSGFTGALMEKLMTLSSGSKKYFETGKIMNFITVDQQMIYYMAILSSQLYSAPIMIIVSLGLICAELGWWGLLSIFFFFVSFVFQMLFNKQVYNIRNTTMFWKDKRAKAVYEYFTGIRIMKYYAWEEVVINEVEKIRQNESKWVIKSSYIRTFVETISNVTPLLISILVIICYIAAGNDLSSAKAYSVLALFNLIMHPIKMFMFTLIMVMQSKASQHRLDHFMDAEERSRNALVENKELEVGTIQISNGNFSWESIPSFQHSIISKKNELQLRRIKGEKLAEELNKIEDEISEMNVKDLSVLHNIHFNAKKGDFIAVIGTVGAGKTTFLHALLGELNQTTGKVEKNGKIAYISQTPWIQNTTVQDCILFGKPYDKELFNKVIEMSELRADLDILPGRELAEIGERGLNLSGGQKQRLCIARALYSEAEIYIIDDCLSALDAHVGKSIFQNVLQGHLKDKTVIFVTHALQYMPKMDKILVLKHGQIVEQGTYMELNTKKDSEFQKLSVQMKKDEDEMEEEMESFDDEIIQNLNEEEAYYNQYNDIYGIPQEGLGQQAMIYFDTNGADAPNIINNDDLKSLASIHTNREKKQSHYQTDSPRMIKSLKIKKPSSKNPSEMLNKVEQEKKKLQQGAMVTKEERAVGSVSWQVYKNYMQSGGRGTFILVIISLISAQIFRIAADWWIGAFAEDKFPQLSTFTYTAIYGAAGILVGIFFVLRGVLFAKFAMECADSYQRRITYSLLRSPMSWFDITPTGRIISRCTKDQDDLDSNLPFSLQNAIVMVLTLLSAIILIVVILPLFFFVAVISLYIFSKIIIYYLISVREIKRIEANAKSPVISSLQESSSGTYTIRAFGRQDYFMERYLKNQHLLVVTFTNYNYTQRWIGVMTELFGLSIIAGACYFAVLSKDFNYTDDSTSMGLAITWSFQISSILNFTLKMIADAESQMNSLVRMLQYIENNPKEAEWKTAQPIKNDSQKVKKITDIENNNNTVAEQQSWPSEGRLEIKNITYKYRPNLPEVIKQISFDINPREKIAIVGRTGSGKSTMTLGLLRIMELSADINGNFGTITVDGKNIADVGLHDLREKCTIIPQDPLLFTGTVKFNVDPLGKYKNSQIVDALKQVHIWEQLEDIQRKSKEQTEKAQRSIQQSQQSIIVKKQNNNNKTENQNKLENDVLSKSKTNDDKLYQEIIQNTETNLEKKSQENIDNEEQLLNTVVDDGGDNFSLGQRQLICMARALIRKPKVLLMDEATASIDEMTDHLIQKMIKSAFKDTTVITIAHRVNTIVQYDRIVVLDYGKVVEIDTPLNLMNKDEGLFSSLVQEGGEEFRQKMIYLAQNKDQDLENFQQPKSKQKMIRI